MSLKKTAIQVHQQQLGWVGIKSAPNPWTGLGPQYNDCMAAQAFSLGIRTRTDYSNKGVSISAFRSYYGWHEIDLIHDGWSDVKLGDLIGEEWPGEDKNGNPLPFTGKPSHIERFVKKEGNRVTTTSANTGPVPGNVNPRGFWQKTRTITDDRNWVVAIRPPYAGEDVETAPYGAKQAHALTKKSDVRLVAKFLNNWAREHHPELPTTRSEVDGKQGHNYWVLDQTYGRAIGLYGHTYRIDGEPYTRSWQIEKIILKRAKAAKAAAKKK